MAVARQMYRWPNIIYEGEVKNGKRHGHGRVVFMDSETSYEGDWVRGARHGQGVLYFDSSRRASYSGA